LSVSCVSPQHVENSLEEATRQLLQVSSRRHCPKNSVTISHNSFSRSYQWLLPSCWLLPIGSAINHSVDMWLRLQDQEYNHLSRGRLAQPELERPAIAVCHSFPDCWLMQHDTPTMLVPGCPCPPPEMNDLVRRSTTTAQQQNGCSPGRSGKLWCIGQRTTAGQRLTAEYPSVSCVFHESVLCFLHGSTGNMVGSFVV
jgi:hypothetical protein